MRIKAYFKVVLFANILLLIEGCIANNKDPKPFTKVINANGEVFIEADKLGDPRHIIVVGKYLLVGNKTRSPLVEIYDISTKKLIDSFLAIGNGPNEVLIIGNVQYIPQRGVLLVADLFKRKLLSYNLEHVLREGDLKPEVIYERDEASTLMFDKLYAGKDFFIAESRDPKGRVLLLDSAGREKAYYLPYPDKEKVDKNLGDINHADLYASAVTVSPALDKVALATYNAGIIDICKLDKDDVVPLWNYTEFYPQGIKLMPMGKKMVVAYTPKSRNGFTNISSSNKYVYALYSGKLSEDPSYPYGNEVYVVSWNGKKTSKIILDRQINRLAVDIKDEYIYGITKEMDIVRFKMDK